jgi:hypothetical protein
MRLLSAKRAIAVYARNALLMSFLEQLAGVVVKMRSQRSISLLSEAKLVIKKPPQPIVA